MKLIITEKPSTARTIAHTVGARERVEGVGREGYYQGGGYIIANARGHIYDLGMPEDYGYSRIYKLDELPMIPDLRIFPNGEDTADLRDNISALINRDDVDEIICATDAGREGELIFRHIYNANRCIKPVKRLWTSSMTDESIRDGLAFLRPDSDYDSLYYAALAREKADWLIGMNLSRLYGIRDNHPHRVGRVKTPVLALIVDNDKKIDNFVSTVTYRLETDSGALSDKEWNSYVEAETALKNIGELVVISDDCEERIQNRPLLHNLTSLSQEANNIYGLTAKQTLGIAQSLYEKRLITYPRTDCNYVSEDMNTKIILTVKKLGENPRYLDRVAELITRGLNLDSRVVNNKKMEGHDHHAIIPEMKTDLSGLSDIQRKIYGLVVNRFLSVLDEEYRYKETAYKLKSGEIIFTLKKTEPVKAGWKKYYPDKENAAPFDHCAGDILDEKVHIKECAAQPPKHFTDATLLSVMNNIDNRIGDVELKAAVAGKGIGTEATRADIIEQLVNAKYIERNGKQIIATEFGRKFIESLPSEVYSIERTAEWEQRFRDMHSMEDTEAFLNEVIDFINKIIEVEKEKGTMQINTVRPDNRIRIGTCPRCGKNIYEGKMNYYCESGKGGCGFLIWKDDRYNGFSVTEANVRDLLAGRTIRKQIDNKISDYRMIDTGVYINLRKVSE